MDFFVVVIVSRPFERYKTGDYVLEKCVYLSSSLSPEMFSRVLHVKENQDFTGKSWNRPLSCTKILWTRHRRLSNDDGPALKCMIL